MSAATVVDTWGCTVQPERLIADLFASAQRTGVGFLVAAGVDAIFLASSPLWWETRRDAWLGNWSILTITVEVMGVEVSVYTPLIDWVTPLVECQDEGGCTLSDEDCSTRPSWVSP